MHPAICAAFLLLVACASGPSPADERLNEVAAIRHALDTGAHADAIQRCDALLERQPDDPVVQHLLIAALSYSPRPADEQRRTALLQHAASRPAEGGAALFTRAAARRETGDLEGAEKDVNRLIDLDGETAQALSLRAIVRVQRGNEAGALADYDRAIELAPAQASLAMQRALLKLKMGKRDAAIADLEAIAKAHPQVPWPAIHLARVHLEDGNAARALAAVDKAIALRTRDGDLALLKSQILETAGRTEESRAWMRRAIDLAPEAPWAPAVRASLQRPPSPQGDTATRPAVAPAGALEAKPDRG